MRASLNGLTILSPVPFGAAKSDERKFLPLLRHRFAELDVGPGAASVQKRLLRQRVNCCVTRAQAGVLLRRLKFALPGWAQAERRRKDWRDQAAQRAAQARAYSGEGHSEEWRFEFSRPYPP